MSSNKPQNLADYLKKQHFAKIDHYIIDREELTVEMPALDLKESAMLMRDDPHLAFDMLVDICGVDYLEYGKTEWATESTASTGFSRAVNPLWQRKSNQTISQRESNDSEQQKSRFAVVYHLLSTQHNHRIRLRVFLGGKLLSVDSVVEVWPVANWFEREAFDLFGILFKGHPDLRRILTDYGFVGHPFRKDFPLIGKVEMRYDAALGRCVYEPVSIHHRVTVPKVQGRG